MSEQYDDEQPQEQSDGGPSIKELRDAADRGTKAQRELVMVKAGVNTDTPLGAMFLDAYKGELTKDAVKAAWDEVAPSSSEAPKGAGEAVAEAKAAELAEQRDDQRAREDAARRGIATTPVDPHTGGPEVDPLKVGYEKFHQNLSDGLSREKAAKPVLEAIIGGAAQGDERFLFSGWTDEEMEEGRTRR